MVNWCVPPIRWLQRFFVPPRDTEDWARISYQPMLYLFAFLAALIVLVFGDFTSAPAHTGGIDVDRNYGVFWIWSGLSLVCPVLALGSLHLIVNHTGTVRYYGLWLRLTADIGQFTAMVVYLCMRFAVGDYHVVPVAALTASTLFVFHLIMRDIRRLWQNEKLAIKIHLDEYSDEQRFR